jgi:hydroxyacylglutathione hydrolase
MQEKVYNQGPFQQNSRILINDKKEAVAFDPGLSVESMIKDIHEKDLQLKAILLTHGHLDHIFGVRVLKEFTKAPVYLHKEDFFLYDNLKMQADKFGLPAEEMPSVDETIDKSNKLDFLGEEIQVLETPGHTPGGVCFYFQKSQFLIVGDTLFSGSIGRTDLWKGDLDTLLNSIRTQLYTLPGETVVKSGHGPDTTISQEKENNPFCPML